MDLTHTLHFGVTFGCGISHLHYILVSHRKDQKMSNPKNRRSLEQWMSIIQEARTSGMTDAQWCLVNGIRRIIYRLPYIHRSRAGSRYGARQEEMYIEKNGAVCCNCPVSQTHLFSDSESLVASSFKHTARLLCLSNE